MTSILLAEDHQVVRAGIASLLDGNPNLRVVAETSDGLEVLPLLQQSQADLLIVDLLLPGLHGLEVVRRVHARQPWVGITVLSMYSAPHYVREALRSGAHAYVLKESSHAVLLQAVRHTLRQERFLDPALSLTLDEVEGAAMSRQDDALDPYAFLTAREREVMQLTVEGASIKESAVRLGISPKTVERHRNNLMKKLGFHNQAELVRFAVYRGLLGPPPQNEVDTSSA